jgi:hypothetical protein
LLIVDSLPRNITGRGEASRRQGDARGAAVRCPKCGALQVERGIGRDPTHYDGYEWEYASYICGYAVSDDEEVGICKKSGTNIEALTRRAEAYLGSGNGHEAIQDVRDAGELGGLQFANTSPRLKAMILHIKAEWGEGATFE